MPSQSSYRGGTAAARARRLGLLFLSVAVFGCRGPTPQPTAPFAVPLVDDDEPEAPSTSQASEDFTPAPTALERDASLDAYRLYASRNNPGLRALYHRWQAAAQRSPQERSLPEPRLTYVEYLRSVQTRTGPQERAIGLSQMFPWFGKLHFRGAMADEAARGAYQRFLAAQLALDAELRDAFADYYVLGRSIEINEESLELLTRLERVERQKLGAGAQNHPDVVRLQVEVGRLEDRLQQLRQLRDPQQAKLNALLNRPLESTIGWPDTLPGDELSWSDEEIERFAREHNPLLRELQHEIERSAFGRKLAAQSYFPDFSLGVQTIITDGPVIAGTPDGGEDPWLFTVSVDLPIWFSRYRAAEREAKARQLAAQRQHEDAERNLLADLRLALYRRQDARRRVRLYTNTLIPKAQEALTTTEAAFRADSSDYLDWIDAQRGLLELQLERERAAADRLRAEAHIDRLLGRFALRDPIIADDVDDVSAEETDS